MSAKETLINKLSITAVIIALVVISSVVMSGQDVSTPQAGIPEDWSHHHVAFTDPGTYTDALKNGNLEHWNRITSDTRYKIQQLKRNLLQRQLQAAPDFAARMELINRSAATAGVFTNRLKRPVPSETKRDWSMDLGLVGAAPATASGTVTSAATGSQTIVIANPNTSTSITLTAAPTTASATGTFSGEPSTGDTITITNGTAKLVLTVSFLTTTTSCSLSGTTRSGTFRRSSTTSTDVTNFLTAINGTNCGSSVGLAATTNNGDVVTVTAAAAGSAGNSIDLAESMSNFTWADASLDGGCTSGVTSGTCFGTSATVATEAGNIVSAINTNGATVGVSGSTTGGGNVTVTAASDGTAGDSITITESLSNFTIPSPLAGGANGTAATMGAGQYPAKFSFSTSATPSCTDYVVYGTGAPGSSGQATVLAYTNLYATTCGSTIPTIKWAYNTGGTAALSPVLSEDGTQVAYIQTVSSVASLVVVKMANSGGTAIAPAAITSVANSAYPTCTAPCYTTLSLSANDTNSPPFYDYTNDVIYVGDDGGSLHQLSHVFKGTVANFLVSSWSTNVSSGDTNKFGPSGALSAPVIDPVTGLIFVGDRYGYLHSVTSAGTGLLTSGQLGNVTAGGPGINDGPLVDVEGATAHVYVFLQNTNSSKFTYINEFATGTSISGSFGTAVGVSGVNGTQLIYDGVFDNQWYTSGGVSGNMYVCGVDSTNNAFPTLFQYALPLTAGTNGATVHTYATLTNAAAGCSPPTEFFNGSTDYLFVSVTGSGTATGCSGACLYSFILPANTTTHTGTASAGLSVPMGASGISVDNSGSATGESQIYFTPQGSQACAGNGTTGAGTGGCAVQASQSGLH